MYVLAGWDVTQAGMRDVLAAAGGRPGHIFNLGHGVMPETDPDVLKRLVDAVHSETAQLMRTGVVLMTYGSPRDLDDVAAYITRVRGGREPSDEVLTEFRRRYERIGMSPLIGITRAAGRGARRPSSASISSWRAGMRFSEPSVASVVADLDGARRRTLARADPVAAVLADC